jgi:hypothetical protein
MEWREAERRHLVPRASATYEYRPQGRFNIEPRRAEERARGLKKVPAAPFGGPREQARPEARHFVERQAQRGEENFKLVDRRKVVLDPGSGLPMRRRAAVDFNLEKAMGQKKRMDEVLERRNGIEWKRAGDKLFAAADYSLGYYNNALWGGGVVPGSNFGFARATQTTSESLKVFGKSLAELWAKSPQLPAVVDMCLARLELPEALHSPLLFQQAMLEYHNEEPAAEVAVTAPLPSSKPSSLPRGGSVSGRAGAGASTGAVPVAGESGGNQIRDEHDAAAALAARRKEIRLLRNAFDVGRTKDISLDKADPRVAMGLLVLFLKEAKPPLLTYDLFEKIMRSQLEPTPAARVEALCPALAMLPAVNETVLFELVRYLSQLLSLPDRVVNSRTLARVFAPVILREDPLKPALAFLSDDSFKRSLREDVVVCMLDNAASVFPASVLQPRKKRAEVPFNLRRALGIALQEFDAVQELDRWEEQCLTTDRSNSSQQGSPGAPAPELEQERGAREDTQEIEELEQIIASYKTHTLTAPSA